MASRVMEITTPLKEDLLFHRLHAREEMSRVAEYQVDLLSPKADIKIDDILGKSVTVKVMLAKSGERFFNGYVTRFAQGGTYGKYNRYVATVRPWLWFLSRTSDCRIFQSMTVPDIVKKVFEEHTHADFKLELTGKYRQWTYCVQYRETDLNFVSRLLEHEGIGYFIKHTDGHDTVVLTDSHSGLSPAKSAEELHYIAPEKLARPDIEHISSWDFSREVQPGVYVHDDYDMERPSTQLLAKKVVARDYKSSDYEMFDYPGTYLQKTDGDQYADVRVNEYATQFEMARGSTNARGMSVGHLFTLKEHPRADQNREYLVTGASFDLEYAEYEAIPDRGGASFSCSFAAMSSKQQFRPRRLTPKPSVQGPQTALVVGPAGDEIYTDKYGRVKVLFRWDREHAKEKQEQDGCSCWIRVSHPWAGKQWGMVAIPRIGQEVIVDFLEGDPDQPIITGRVYNAEQMPPYALPANMTQTGIKSRSTTKGEPANFNEFRFEDKKGSEQVYLHAEKNQDIEVENDETHWVGHDRTKTIDNDETTHVKGKRTETVDKDETITVSGARSESVAKDETIAISGNRTESVKKDETVSIDKNRTSTVGESETLTIKKDQTTTINGNRTLTVDKKESITVSDSRKDDVAKNEDISVGKNRQASIGDNDSLKVGKKLLVDAGDEVTIKTGSASITMKKDGTITIKGKDITLDGSGKINIKASSDVIIKGSKVTQN